MVEGRHRERTAAVERFRILRAYLERLQRVARHLSFHEIDLRSEVQIVEKKAQQ
jgi:hypothetical protein